MNNAFNDWWNGDNLTIDNPFGKDTPAYWAWEGWVAGVKTEREECAKLAQETVYDTNLSVGIKTPKELFFSLCLSIGSVIALIIAMVLMV